MSQHFSFKQAIAFFRQDPWLVLATGFGTGFLPLIPGTWGTLPGVLLFLLIQHWTPLGYAAAIVFCTLLGIWLCGRAEHALGEDAPAIVWDEITGILITYFVLPTGWGWLLAGFVLFRFLDMVKPWPISWLNHKVAGGVGVMVDDIVAGLVACGGLHIAALWFS